jgi:hypothetical protein
MPIAKQTESSFTPVPVGNHIARCYGVVALGTQVPTNPQFNPQEKCVLMFELCNEHLEINGEKKPLQISHFLNCYLGRPAKPSKTNIFLTAWRGRQFTEQELAGFDIAKVLGAACMLNVVHEDRGGKMREVIASIAPVPKGMQVPLLQNKQVHYEISDGKGEKFAALPEWMQKMISACAEWNTPAAPVDPPAPEHAPTTPTEGDDVPF